MPEDLPIYSESVLRTRSQFADLEKLKSVGTATVWEKSDKFIEQFEGAVDVRHARESLTALTKPNLLHAHAILFSGRENAGILRQEALSPVYRGQDCPAPQFIDRSLQNFFNWLSAESISEIHPLERAALVLTRIRQSHYCSDFRKHVSWPGWLHSILFSAGICERVRHGCRSSDGYRNSAVGERNLQNR